MKRDVVLLLSLVAVFAGWLVAHLVLLARLFRSPQLRARRWLALLPPLAPLLGWRAGQRGLSLCWVLLALGYVILLALSHA